MAMFRKSSLAAALLMTLGAGNALALGLGEIELKSALNQPLDAEVELLSVTNTELEELRVAIGSTDSFARAGIDRPMFLTRLQFDVKRNTNGSPVIHISSRDTVQEPFLDFILEVSWSKGRLVREYTVLVDPPVTMPAPPPVASAPAVRTRQAESVQQPRRFTRTGNFPTVPVSPGEYGPTKRNDTLWKIAEQVRPDNGVSMEQTMLGLLWANPQAFIGNNINNLKAGYVLRVPDRDTLTSVSKADALSETRAQYAAWRAARGVPATDQQPVVEPAAVDATATADVAEAAGGEPSLQLVAPDMEDGSALAGGDTGESRVDALQRELMMANEVLETQRRQDEEMSRRLATLEEQITNMQRLIQLKDNELARLQAVAGDAADDGVAAEMAIAETAETPLAEEAVADGIDAPVEDIVAETSAEFDDSTEAGIVAGSVVDDEMAAVVDDPAADIVDEETAGDEMAVEGEFASATEAGDEVMDGPADVVTEELLVAEIDEDGTAVPPPVELPVEPVMPAEEASPDIPETATTPGFVDRLLQNPVYLGAGALALALLGFFGIRRKRGVEAEFQESILQAAQEDSSISMTDSVEVPRQESAEQATSDSSLLSEFAVSDMGSMRSSGEADPLAEADVYLAYGRYQQAEDLIREAMQDNADNEDLDMKLLEIYLASRNQAGFDEHAQDILARLENSEDPMWEKVSEMGRELNPENPIYQAGAAASAVDGEVDEIEELEEGLDFDFSSLDQGDEITPQESADSEPAGDTGLDFNVDLPGEISGEDQHPDVEFTPETLQDEAAEAQTSGMDVTMDSVEPDAVTQDDSVEFDIESFDLGDEEAADSGDGELADLDEISTKLDLARAYIDMGDPDGARSILDEVMQEGSNEQKDEAENIMQMIA